MKLDWRDYSVFAVIAIVILFAVFYPWGVSAQAIEIRTGIDTYQRELPQTVEEGQELSAGLADTLNTIITAWESDNADAAVKVQAIMEGNRTILKSAKQADSALRALPGGLLAKTLALGVYASGNPLGRFGDPDLAFGPSVTWNVWNLGLLTGRAGVLWAPSPRLDASLALEWWIF